MIRTVALALADALLWPAAASAHRLDEYLQAARVSLERARVLVEIDLTPGAAVASTIVPLIDRDADGAISPAEIGAYGRAVLADVTLTLDGHALALELMTIDAPTIGEMREGMGTIRLRATAPGNARWGTRVLSLRNRHQPAVSVYMANALLSNDRAITVVSQTRDRRQSEARFEYDVAPDMMARVAWSSIGVAGLGVLMAFRRRSI